MRKVDASFTVEATFILPMVLFTMVFIIYLSFYLHDYCRIQNIVDGVAHKVAMNIKHEADIDSGRVNYDELNKGLLSQVFEEPDAREADIKNYIGRLLSKGLIITRITDIHVTKDILNLTIRVEGEYQFPIKGLGWLIALDNHLTLEREAAFHYPANFVRISDVILDTGSRIKGFNNLKETIIKLIPNK